MRLGLTKGETDWRQGLTERQNVTFAPIVAFPDKTLENAIDNHTETNLRFKHGKEVNNASLLYEMPHYEGNERR